MSIKGTIQQRFDELASQPIGSKHVEGYGIVVDEQSWGNWSSSALNLIQMTFGAESAHYSQLKQTIESDDRSYYSNSRKAVGIFCGAKADFEKGCYTSLDKMVSGEVFGDFLGAAKTALNEGNKDVIAAASWSAPALWRFGRREMAGQKSGRGLPQSKTRRGFGR